MAVEIEAKVAVEGFDSLIKTLKKVGGVNKGKIFIKDYYFDSAGILTENDSCLRLRTESEYPSKRLIQYVLCYKGAKLGGEYKSRREIETSVGSAENTAAILDRLGWKESLVIEKIRDQWYFEDTLICLDTLGLIGQYVEIEGRSEESVTRVKKILGLGSSECEKRSYAELITLELKSRSSDIHRLDSE
ncbi:putative adenylyl cyclase CyaB [Limihaloglobus sulfuriphilus]|uniref:Putative adenylyl cyclase CyaB n=1 Tax=Limihaloglobus sulfuriphilus TaxID=1851148 RepID=A0A1Q2MHQ1_9BACT|nr:class IV adenylate cyclase [Limihaloglobus sulfuriphilus]AQQ72221.1 putative adenylyl cyclase CyaB [Limihaloglobus sulfuriphilus]